MGEIISLGSRYPIQSQERATTDLIEIADPCEIVFRKLPLLFGRCNGGKNE